MDIAYDHIAEETYTDRATTPKPTPAPADRPSLNTEFQETFRAFSNSPWGAKLGGLWGNVRKQGETYYEEAKREVEEASGEALKGFTDLQEQLVSRTRGMSLGEEGRDPDADVLVEKGEMPKMRDVVQDGPTGEKERARTESEVIRENDSLVARFRSEATKRLKDLEKAEDAADEALLRFGTNIRNFLRDAVSVAPPSDGESAAGDNRSEVLFESKDAAGKRVLHTTRLDAQLHVIHTTMDKFTKDPESDEWVSFKDGFKIDKQTQRISVDLERYPELRKAMKQLVPEKVEYKDFWCRYYFLRMVLEAEEQRRKEMLKGRDSGFVKGLISTDHLFRCIITSHGRPRSRLGRRLGRGEYIIHASRHSIGSADLTQVKRFHDYHPPIGHYYHDG